MKLWLCVAALGMLGAGSSPSFAQDDPAKLFAKQCGICHGDPNIADSKSRLGPDLHGLSGRTAGTSDFARYSPAMKRSDIVWSNKTLDMFLAAPRTTVRGTIMAYPGLKDDSARKRLVRYILSASE
ncbi:hypothetical protein B5C34_14190 [Pacificimonas flava]|uniref:Cytochrome c domain-containing protein n=2 Tax=Pacificimonas TaxID=1960290 RepID=A0A219B8L5_9SPHN|nr:MULTISPECIES: c-type cytochrome [Pacificimonas]MBZ6379974.1 c-type cytochrome [Pacificimonas aurantium]OWV34493.1 hypothetical protein B5C34_14190 [Pacificimonas flava]